MRGCQFVDLDGQGPDTAMLCYGRDAIYPTLDFERCREGAENLYLYSNLSQMADTVRARHPQSAALPPAETMLRQLDDAVSLDQRHPPQGYEPQALKRRAIALCEDLTATLS